MALPYGGIGHAGGRRGKGSLEVDIRCIIDTGKVDGRGCMSGVEVTAGGRGDMGKVGVNDCMCGS